MNKPATAPAGIMLAAVLALCSATASAERNPADPYERYNRLMYKVNDTADRYVMAPVARGYRKITPGPVRTGVNNFFNNLRDVVSFGSNVLRLDVKRASEDFVRVGINTTFGLGGLINIADAGGVPNNKNTLGDTFASWGWKNSNYLVLPLMGPSTVRDGLGTAVTTAFPVKNAVFETPAGRWGSTAAGAVNTREQLLDLTDSLDEAAVDKYAYTRDIFMRVRSRQTGGQAPAGIDEDIDIDELVDSGTPEGTTAVPDEAAMPEPAENSMIQFK